jgi:hypothetical protein
MTMRFYEEGPGHLDNGGDTIFPHYRLTLETDEECLEGKLEAFKMFMYAVGHSGESVDRITAEAFTERLERMKAEKVENALKQELYDTHMEKKTKRKKK